MNKEQLIKEIEESRLRLFDLKSKLNEINFEERKQNALNHLGKCYKEVNNIFPELFRYLYVYGISDEYQLLSISVSGYLDENKYFKIEDYGNFNPDADNFVQVDKSIFETNYNLVKERIHNSINNISI